MALFFQTRERPELNRSVQVKEAREYVCPVEQTTNERPVGYAARLDSLMQRVTKLSLQQIDDIVATRDRRVREIESAIRAVNENWHPTPVGFKEGSGCPYYQQAPRRRCF